ncbi:alcohol dehydrogenase GroES domain-containing protein [Tanticharoenia sakaeratensis NBRC 103193]|uniref:Alcohol dehydrogenase GroES domain-containing protein n=2 Tax=Tanticharoenia TaxID=444052 RepID=A0A0D6MJU9_9PROT|nr:alcohol dehydrogenase GroES domain-containing protein [Tanticharoenia sakaeratensis NBRC 103193]GBQ25220.1 putative alcohol/aldehyde dehydrogenase [Tanticharoenia sakaeratensis NBRC 103193]
MLGLWIGETGMKALTWQKKGKITCKSVPDPKIEDGRDVIIKVTSCAICGSDLHLLGGFMPTMQCGDVLGHETMGEVVDVGRDNTKLKVGDRIVVPFTISCGECRQCRWGNWSCCERTNPNGKMQAETFGYPLAGLFGFSHITGGYAGGQAEYLRVPYADVGPIKIPDGIEDEKVLFLSDIFPTGYQAAEYCEITPEAEKTIAIFGCGPVGLMAIRSCFLLGAKRVIAIDTVPERLAMARASGAETIDFQAQPIQETLIEMTGGLGPDAVIEAVGMESHGADTQAQKISSAIMSAVTTLERPFALNQAILACRPGGILSMPGVYAGPAGPIMVGVLMNKGLTLRTGQTHVQRYLEPLLGKIMNGDIDPSTIISHRSANLEDGPALYEKFRDKSDHCTKVVFHPHG